MLLAGASPNSVTPFLHSAPVLCIACAEGNDKMVAMLLEYGAASHSAGTDGVCALSHAAIHGRTKCISMLLRFKATVSIIGIITYHG